VLLSVLQVWVLLLRRETDGRKRAADEVETRTEGVRHANENVLRPRTRTVLRAAGRHGRWRVLEGIRPGGGGQCHCSIRFGVDSRRGAGRGRGGQRQFRTTAVGRIRVHVCVHRLRCGHPAPA